MHFPEGYLEFLHDLILLVYLIMVELINHMLKFYPDGVVVGSDFKVNFIKKGSFS